MRISNIAKLIGCLLLGCSTEHTIANDADTEQSMQVIARPICSDMCQYSLGCKQIATSDFGNCLNQCETDCTRLEALIPTRRYNTNGIQYTGSAADVIAQVSSCYLASQCATSLQPMCHPRDIGSHADTLEGKANPTLNGTVGISNCGMRENATTCESTISQNRNKAEAWSVSCQRADQTASEWTCQCVEYGVQVATVTGTLTDDDPAFLELCWSKEQLACFYKGEPNCGKSTAGAGAL
ncbi:MAG TPA: hypothetical protein VIV60_02000 [Polyangiaceae bacterium]